MTEADFSDRGLGAADAIIIAAFLPRCTALTSLILFGYRVGAKGVEALALAISEANGRGMALNLSMSRLCGVYVGSRNGSEEGEFNSAGLVALSKSMPNLKALDVSHNCLNTEGAKILAAAIGGDGSALETVTFGDGVTDYIKKSECSGSSFEVGSEVMYKGVSRRIVTNDSYDYDRVKLAMPAVTM